MGFSIILHINISYSTLEKLVKITNKFVILFKVKYAQRVNFARESKQSKTFFKKNHTKKKKKKSVLKKRVRR